MTQIIALLFNSLWESVIALAAAALVLRLAKNANATTRYAVWTAALVCSVILPIITTVATVTPLQRTTAQPHVTAAAGGRFKQAPVASLPVAQERAASPTAMPPVPQRAQFALTPTVMLVIAALWLLAALYNGVRLALSVATLESLKRNATPLPIEYRNRLAGWQTIAVLSHRVRLCLSDEISVPVAVGIFDAMILLPASLVDELDAEDIDRIVLHEYAHLRRGDDWINAFQRVVLAVLFFNPAVRYIGRQMDIEREVSCDDSVVNASGDALPLASCLVKMVEKVAWPYEPLAAPGVFDSRRNISMRVERLLQFARDRRTRVSAVPTIGAVAAMFALVLVGALVSPRFVYAQDVKAALPPQKVKTPSTITRHIPTFPKTAAPSTGVSKVRTARSPERMRVPMPANKATRPAEPTRMRTSAPLRHMKAASPPPSVTVPHASYAYALNTKVNASAHTSVNVNTSTMTPTSIAAIGGDYISELANAGYTGLSVDELVQMKSVGVDAAYIHSLQAAGYAHLSPRELIQARAVGLTASYIQAMRGRLGALTLRDVTELSALGVSSSYIDELASAGYRGLTGREVREMKALGIDAAFIRSASDHGLKNLTVSQLIRLKASGVL